MVGFLFFIYYLLVLISTYWNVNAEGDKAYFKNNTVLISTYWNVNPCADLGNLQNRRCFNLNLLECKFRKTPFIFQNINVLISTYWNVNMTVHQFRRKYF